MCVSGIKSSDSRRSEVGGGGRGGGRRKKTTFVFAILLVGALYSSERCEARAVRGGNRNRNNNNNNNNINNNQRRSQRNQAAQDNQQSFWMCPQVICPPLAAGCESSEYIVLEYDTEGRDGRVISVRCESCEYCLDLPTSSSDTPQSHLTETGSAAAVGNVKPTRHSRVSRSLFHVSGRHRGADDLCSSLHCPDLSDHCEDIRMTKLFVDDHQCKRCPACYDTLITLSST